MKIPSPTIALKDSFYESNGVEVFMKRDDLIHPVVSGNKWRKLKHNLAKMKQGKYEKLLTFGGAYSNHIAATAAVGNNVGVETIGVIRGNELSASSNDTLAQAAENGMELIFTSREEYDLRDEKYYHEELRRRHGNVWIVPEGGANFYGVLGCQEILKEEIASYDFIYCAAGTATTVAGLLLAAKDAKVVGVSALKGGEFLKSNLKWRLKEFGFDQEVIDTYLEQFELETNYHFGGYAKNTAELIEFMNTFYKNHGIALDQIYTAKMMFALNEHIRAGKIYQGAKVLVVHTGGLQGNNSIRDQLLFD